MFYDNKKIIADKDGKSVRIVQKNCGYDKGKTEAYA